MPIKKCPDCKKEIRPDKKSGKYWCVNCNNVKETYIEKYRIAVLGKNTGTQVGINNYIKRLKDGLIMLGHDVIDVLIDDIISEVHQYDLEESIKRKKKIPLKCVEYYLSPDFIIVEQTYNRYDVSDINCPIIYCHREYTHFPDIEDPDILLGTYPQRLEFFEFYHPYTYYRIPYADTCYVAVDPDIVSPSEDERLFSGVTFLDWSAPAHAFADANGIAARMAIENQVAFVNECKQKGYINHMAGGNFRKYLDLLGKCEAVLIDAGYINYFGRRLFEAVARKTLMVVRVHHNLQMEVFREIGLTEDICYFIYEPDDLKNILKDWNSEEKRKERQDKIELAYKWVLKNHTYLERAKKIIDIFERFMRGEKRKPFFMGYAQRYDVELGTKGDLEVHKL